MTGLVSVGDRKLSPYTGYTRANWLQVLHSLVSGVLRHVDPKTGVFHLAGDPGETALAGLLRNPGGLGEVFDRTHLLMAVYIAATGRTRIEGYDGDIAELYRQGLNELYGQEARGQDARAAQDGLAATRPMRGPAAGALAMLLAPKEFLDGLAEPTKAGLREHLAKYIHRATRDCNTMLFSMMPAAVLDRLGGEYDRALLDDYFDQILSMYRGDGWFIDGWNRGFDFYNFWGFQLYLHALMAYDSRWRQQYADRVREITAAHEETLLYWFGRDGAPIAKGRSLNYRFAAVSGIAYSQLSGLSSLDPGLARRIASGCLKYFREAGCISERGLLEVGYHGPNAALGEDYSDRGAPYWASTGLVALALGEEHPFWSTPEQPLPADGAGLRRLAVPGAQMVLKVDGGRGEARALVAGEPFLHRRVWQAGTKYYQHAYSSTLGFPLAGEGGPQLAVGRTGISADGKAWAYRTWPRAVHLDSDGARSEWDAWCAAEGMTGTVITHSRLLDRGELHVFWHQSGGPRYLAIGGWAVQVAHGESPQVEREHRRVLIQSESMWSLLHVLAPMSVAGEIEVEEVRPRPGFRHAHLFGGWSAYPVWRSLRPVDPGETIAVFVDAARRAESPRPEYPPLRVRIEDGKLVVEADQAGR